VREKMKKGDLVFSLLLICSLIASFAVPLIVNFWLPLLPFTIWLTGFTSFMSYGSILLIRDKPDPSWTLKERFDFLYARAFYPIMCILCWLAAIVLWLVNLGIKM